MVFQSVRVSEASSNCSTHIYISLQPNICLSDNNQSTKVSKDAEKNSTMKIIIEERSLHFISDSNYVS